MPSPSLAQRYREVRGLTEALCEPLAVEDYVIQSMPDASPAKWHLAHTTWFFETFVLSIQPGYRPFDARYKLLFNSYYNTVGEQWERPRRGLLSRPTVREVYDYRHYVDEHMRPVLDRAEEQAQIGALVTLGLHHEQQHQELLLMDVKHLFASNPLRPAYRQASPGPGMRETPVRWLEYAGGIVAVGHAGQGFAYDNESPRHDVLLRPFALASRLVSCAEYLDFIEAGGYRKPDLWLSQGWATLQSENWQGPLYWEHRDGQWQTMTLAGLRPLAPHEPVCHVSYFEAEAYARWRDARLPSEQEWETAARELPVEGNFVESGLLHPSAPGEQSDDHPAQMFGDAWEWTLSPYVAYPGYRPAPGALGEYNGKFMCNQYVLRGGCCISPRSHLRATYRNFFAPESRWAFAGIRLARDCR